MEDKSIKTPSGYEIRENSGNLFKNNSENPKAPAYRGLVNVDGKGYDLALWKTEKGYLNIKFTEHKISEDGTREEYKYDRKTTNLTPEQAGKIISDDMNKKDEFNDDIPF
jgi:hypothetical protein